MKLLALLCLPWALLPAQGRPPTDQEIQACLDRARPHLLEASKQARAGRLALLCLALLHDEVPARHPVLAAALQRLADEPLDQCYDLSLRLMVMAEHRSFPDRRKLARKDCRQLLRHQRSDGGFTYNPSRGRSDLSNTQYAALGLRAAASLQLPIKATVWQRLRRYTLGRGVYRGGFSYSGRSPRITVSMTVAGIAILQICAGQLAASEGRSAKAATTAVRNAWKWLERRGGEIGKGSRQMRNYYFHYGLERAAILCDKTKVGHVDWFRRGARMLLEQESPGGAWSAIQARPPARRRRGRPVLSIAMPADPVLSSFAVLFLRRKFQKTLRGPITPAGLTANNLPKGADAAQIKQAIHHALARGLAGVPQLIKALRSPILARRKAAAAALPRLSGRFFDLSPYRSPAENSAMLKEIERWWLKEGRAAAASAQGR